MGNPTSTVTAAIVSLAVLGASVYWYKRHQSKRTTKSSTQGNAGDNATSTANSNDDKSVPGPLKERFEASCQHMKSSNYRLTNEQQLKLYGWYKQATEGNMEIDTTKNPRPSSYQVVKRAKYDAWKSLHGMDRGSAMQTYIDFVVWYEFTKETVGGHDDQADIVYDDDDGEEGDDNENVLDAGGMGLKPSTLASAGEDYGSGGDSNESGNADPYSLHKAARDDNVTLLRELLQSSTSSIDVNSFDESNQTALHLAADRGSVDCVTLLLDAGANVLAADTDGFTALHVAVIANQLEVCRVLLQNGANPLQEDNDGDTPLSSCDDDTDDEIKGLLQARTAATPSTKEEETATSMNGKPDLSVLDSIPLELDDDGDM